MFEQFLHRRLAAFLVPFIAVGLGKILGVEIPQDAVDRLIEAAMMFTPAALALWSYLQKNTYDSKIISRRLVAGIGGIVIVTLKTAGIVIPDEVMQSVIAQGSVLATSVLALWSYAKPRDLPPPAPSA